MPTIFECDMDPSPWRDQFLRTPLFTLDDGMVQPFDRAGLGLDIDESALCGLESTTVTTQIFDATLFRGKVALLTGAATGIGAGIAKAFC